MKIKVQLLVGLLDNTQRVYKVIGAENKLIDGKEYVPVIFDIEHRPRLAWVSKDAYETKNTIIEVDINV